MIVNNGAGTVLIQFLVCLRRDQTRWSSIAKLQGDKKQIKITANLKTKLAKVLVFRQFIPIVYESKTIQTTCNHKQLYRHTLITGFGYLLDIIRPKTSSSKFYTISCNF
jgi:hypothetical protein